MRCGAGSLAVVGLMDTATVAHPPRGLQVEEVELLVMMQRHTLQRE